MATLHGGRVVARALRREGVEVLFTLTGGHILPILDGCVQEGIRVVDVRHEQTAAHAAEAWTRLTGRLGVAAVTAGPGVTDAVTGVANAWYSRTPMLLIGGRHAIRQEQMGGLQEMDHPRLFASITAWAGTGWETARLAETVSVATRHAFAGRGGPVFLDVPMDLLYASIAESAVLWPEQSRANLRAGATTADLATLRSLLAAAERPLLFAGGGYEGGAPELRALAEMLGAPLALNSRARGSLPHGHPLACVNARGAAFAAADVVLALGVDFDFRAGYGRRFAADARVIQIDREPGRIGWNRPVACGLVADPATVVTQLLEACAGIQPRGEWAARMAGLEVEALARAQVEAAADGAPVAPQRFGREVGEFFGPDALVAVDGGDIVSTTARWLQTSTQGHLLDPGPFGTLGTGPGFALAAQLAFPDRLVGLVYGDGGFGFHAMEFDTFLRHRLPILGVVGNDGVWNNIKTFHRATYPDRLVATDLGVQRYDRVVAGLGGHGEFVERAADLRPALERARATGRAALVNVHIAETARASSNYQQ